MVDEKVRNYLKKGFYSFIDKINELEKEFKSKK
jgi:hypothetical protein